VLEVHHGGHAVSVEGEEFAAEEWPPLYATLARAGEDGWELIAFDSSERAMIFKRPKVEDRADARHLERAEIPEAPGTARWIRG
jgi:hypothetical protein